MAPPAPLPRESRWIPWTIAGVFVAFVLAGLTMVVIALRSDPGLVAGAPARLGTGNVLPPATGLRLDVRQAGGGSGPVRVEARLRDRNGRPAPAAAVAGALQRATDARADAAVAFAPAPAADPDGAVPWRATLPGLPAGAWDLAVEARDEAGNVLATATLRLAR
jgi:nitrogen fixation protein FixH